jgi:hypothetical protein
LFFFTHWVSGLGAPLDEDVAFAAGGPWLTFPGAPDEAGLPATVVAAEEADDAAVADPEPAAGTGGDAEVEEVEEALELELAAGGGAFAGGAFEAGALPFAAANFFRLGNAIDASRSDLYQRRLTPAP